MKVSQFTTFIPQDDMVVGYNTLSDHFLALNPTLHEMIESGRARDNIEELDEIHPQLYKALKDTGFVVESDLDEVQIVKDAVRRIDRRENTYSLTINPTMNCNFKCWYCYETHIKGSKMVTSTLDRVYRMIDRQLEEMTELEQYSVSFFGGEPLLNYRDVVVPIIDYAVPRIKERGIDVGISFTSNGYLVTQDMIDYLKSFSSYVTFQITLDGNRETHDTIRFVNKKRGSYDEIIKNVRLLLNNELPVVLRVNYTKKTLMGIADIIPDLADLDVNFLEYLKVDFHQVWQDGEELGELTNDVLMAFVNAGLCADSPYKFPNNVAGSCYADKKNSAVINYNGDVFKCTARDFTTANREGYLDEDGTIVFENARDVMRLESKFRNRPCLGCFMLPICNGGCSQHAMEHYDEHDDYCIYNFDESKKQQIVLDKFNFKYNKN